MTQAGAGIGNSVNRSFVFFIILAFILLGILVVSLFISAMKLSQNPYLFSASLLGDRKDAECTCYYSLGGKFQSISYNSTSMFADGVNPKII